MLARVINQDTGLECYVPGIVYMTPKRQQSQAKFYTVTLYTTQQVQHVIIILLSEYYYILPAK